MRMCHRSNSGLSSRLFPREVEQTMKLLIAEGGDTARFVELAPNRHLAGLAKRINRRLPIESLAQMPAETAK